MSREVRIQKLDSIARCLERLTLKTPKTPDELTRDIDLQESIMINMERLVQLCVDTGAILIAEKRWSPMPSSMAAVFDVLNAQGILPDELRTRMKKAVGFRNLAVHEYDKINWDIVFRVLTHHLDDFRKFASILDGIE